MPRKALPLKSPVQWAFAVVMAAGLSQPAHAAADALIPEPDMLVLLGLAIAGVVVGRRLASKRPPED